VLTNFHVVGPLTVAGADLSSAQCCFDYVGTEHDSTTAEIREVMLFSPPAPGDNLRSGSEEFDDEHLDYAILRIAPPFGKFKAQDGRLRGWLTLPRTPPTPQMDSPIILLHHPSNGPDVQLTVQASEGHIRGKRGDGWRVTYDLMTEKGSSGGVCLSKADDFAFVALHNAGGGEGWLAQAIPIDRIVRHIRRKLRGDIRFLGLAPPAGPAPNDQKTAALLKDGIKRRETAALSLMDRSTEENLLLASANGEVPARRGLVHVVVCKERDGRTYFYDRLKHLSFSVPLQQGMAARLIALKKGLAEPSRIVAKFAWPRIGPLEARRTELAGRLLTYDDKSRYLLIIERLIDEAWDVATERSLAQEFAAMLARKFGGNADLIQAIIVFIIPAGAAEKALTASFAGMWNSADAPEHCGICLSMGDVEQSDLTEWSGVLEEAWGVNASFAAALERLFDAAKSHPLIDVVECLRTDLAQYITSILDSADGMAEDNR